MPTVGRLPDDGEHNLVLRRVLVQDAEGRVGDHHSGVLLHVDAADRHQRLTLPLALSSERTRKTGRKRGRNSFIRGPTAREGHTWTTWTNEGNCAKISTFVRARINEWPASTFIWGAGGTEHSPEMHGWRRNLGL